MSDHEANSLVAIWHRVTGEILHGWGFALLMGVLSRLFILANMLLIAPLGATSTHHGAIGDWQVLSGWDSVHYLDIATHGYEYSNDGKGHTVAFFPVLPLLIRGGMALGLSPELAGVLVNNLAFLVALIVLYYWLRDRYSTAIARWSVAVLAWCPFSLFGTVIYTEGLFLLFSTAALRAFDRQRYGQVFIWGSLATATRPPGIALIPAFLVIAWHEKRPPIAYVTALLSATGLLLFSGFCWIRFGDPLAFVWVQKAWHPSGLAYGEGWLKTLVQITLGPTVWNQGRITDPLYPLAFLVICSGAYGLWRLRRQLKPGVIRNSSCLLAVLLWLLAGSPLINAVMIGGGAYLLWHLRRDLQPIVLVYGVFSLMLILSSGRTISVERHAYGVVSLAIAMGLLLSRYPRWGYPVIGFFALLLSSLAIRFAQNLWAG